MIKIILPSTKSKVIRGAGQLNKNWWSNGGYDFQYKRRKFWRLCLEREGKPNVGYNAVITKVGDTFKGLIWLDSATSGYTEKELAEKVINYYKIKSNKKQSKAKRKRK